MYINGIAGYLSRFEGTEVDAAVARTQTLDAEFALKVDKSTEVNGHALEGDINITATDVGALPDTTQYGASISWSNGILSLLDVSGIPISSQYVTSEARWGHIAGLLSDQEDLQEALDEKYDSSNPAGYVTADDIPVVDQVYDGTSQNAQSGTAVAGAISTKQNTITAQNMLSSDLVDDTNKVHKFATAAQLSQIATNTGNISSINSKIPSVASSSNQLADKEFVNSSIASNTANFIGTFNSLAELEAYSGPLTNNDYAFVTNVDGEGNTSYDRYKYTTATTPPSWVFEYELNNSSFTAAQWDAINSGIDAILTAQISTNATDIININSTLENYGNIVTHDVSEFATSAQGALADTALQPNDNISELTNNVGYITGISSSDVTTALGYTPYNSTNPNGYISSASLSGLTDTSISSLANKQFLEYNSSNSKWENKSLTSSDVTTALGYTPYSNSNPSGYISGITSSDVTTALGYTPYNSTNPDGYISGITSSDVTTALGYTPYNSTNPDGFISSASLSDLTDTSISSPVGGQIIIYNSTSGKWENTSAPVAAVWGNITGTLSNQTDLQNALNAKQNTINGAASTIASDNLTGSRVLISDDSGKVAASSISTTKLGYLTDVTSNIQVQLNGKQATISNLSSIESGAAAGSTALQPNDNISELTNNVGYITGITSSDVTTALGYTPYNSTNPDGYITGISSSDVTTALGYTPYNSTNPSGYISSAALSTLTDVSLSNVANGQVIAYNSTSGKWENKTSTQVTAWGDITGTLSNQTDLQNALNAKQNTINGAASTIASDNLTISRVLVSNDSGKVVASSISTTKLGYLTDVNSNIQVQLNGKQATLVSGTNIKTINNKSLLGDGNIDIQGSVTNPIELTGTEVLLDPIPAEYKRLLDITFDGNVYYIYDGELYGTDDITLTIDPSVTSGQNVCGCYTSSSVSDNFSLYISANTNGSYFRYGSTLYRPVFGSPQQRTITIGSPRTYGFSTDITGIAEQEFTTSTDFYIGALPNSTSAKFKGTFSGNIQISDRVVFIPVERISDGEIGYYIPSINSFLENQGDGTPTTSGYDTETYTSTKETTLTLGVETETEETYLAPILKVEQEYTAEGTTTTNTFNIATEPWVTAQGYTSNVGTVTSVNNIQPDANGNVTISAGGASIDDTTPSTTSVYSSQKTQDLIDALVARIAALETNINGGNA